MRVGLLCRLVRVSLHFPELGLKSRSLECLPRLHADAEPERYMAMSASLSLCAGAAGLLAAAAACPAFAAPAALLAFALAFALLLRLPALELARRNAEICADLPFFLRTAGMLADLGIPFQRALETAAGERGALAEGMGRVLGDVKAGAGLPRALSSFAVASGSLPAKRAVARLLSAYETGAGGRELVRIGDELLAQERHRLKEYSARSAMFGLFFMMTSAILPTFFLVYAVLGGFAFGSSPGHAQIALGLLVAFPAASVLIALLSKATMPRSAFAGDEGLDMRLLLPGGVFMAGSLLLPQFQAPALAAGAALAAWLAHSAWAAGRRVEEIEAQLPDALFSVAGLPKSSRLERVFRMIGEGGHGALSEEAAKSARQLALNIKGDAVLDDFAARIPSVMARRAALVIRQMVATNSLDRLGALADDMLAAFQIKRERGQMFAMQKYTLAAGALLIPLILKMTLKLLDGMGGFLGGGDAAGTVAFAHSVVPPYLVIYGLICSAVIADAEGRPSSAGIYFALLAGTGLLAFHFINL